MESRSEFEITETLLNESSQEHKNDTALIEAFSLSDDIFTAKDDHELSMILMNAEEKGHGYLVSEYLKQHPDFLSYNHPAQLFKMIDLIEIILKRKSVILSAHIVNLSLNNMLDENDEKNSTPLANRYNKNWITYGILQGELPETILKYLSTETLNQLTEFLIKSEAKFSSERQKFFNLLGQHNPAYLIANQESIIKSAIHKDKATVSPLLDKLENLDEILFYAMENNAEDFIYHLLKENRIKDVNFTDKNGLSLLHFMIKCAHLDGVRLLIAKNANVTLDSYEKALDMEFRNRSVINEKVSKTTCKITKAIERGLVINQLGNLKEEVASLKAEINQLKQANNAPKNQEPTVKELKKSNSVHDFRQFSKPKNILNENVLNAIPQKKKK